MLPEFRQWITSKDRYHGIFSNRPKGQIKASAQFSSMHLKLELSQGLDKSKRVRKKVSSSKVSIIAVVISPLPIYQSNVCEFSIDKLKIDNKYDHCSGRKW
jgi:hypothetical protein